jgi:hypothetical protein
MAVTPLSTPLKTEYKPLGLEAFAQPLSDMQAQFDTAKESIESADFALARLSQDDTRAKDLLKEIEQKRDDLANNLISTGNYRQATSKLRELNKVYNKDTETNAIKGNYEAYKEAVKKEKERVDKGDITQKDFDVWDFKVKNSFKGTDYKKDDDTYTSINVHPRMKNMEKELREESLKLAGMAPEQIEEWVNTNQVDAFTKERIQTLLKVRDRDQVAGEIERFLRTSDQYKDWVNEDADYKWYYNDNTDPEFKEKFVNAKINQYDDKIAYWEQFLDDPNAAQTAQKQIASLQAEKEKTANDANAAANNGTFDKFSKGLFFDEANGRFGTTSYAASDIVDMRSKTYTITDQVDTAGQTKANDALKLLKEIDIATNITGITSDKTKIISGTSTATTDENIAHNNAVNAFEQIKNTPAESIPDLSVYDAETAPLSPASKVVVGSLLDTSKDLYVTLNRMNDFSKGIEDKSDEITLKKEELAKANSTEEKAKLSAELDVLYQDKEEKRIALTDDTRTLDNILDAEMNADYITPELRKLYEEQYSTDPAQFFRTLRAHTDDYLEAAYIDGLTGTDGELQKLRMLTEGGPNIQRAASGRAPYTTKENAFTQLANNVMKAYKWNLSVQATSAVGEEVIMTKGFDNFARGASEEIKQYVLQNQRGASDVKKVNFNILTGESKETGENEFTLANYNTEPHYDGVDKDGNIILRYVRQEQFDPNTQTGKEAVAKWLISGQGRSEASLKTTPPTKEEIAAFNKANPQDLYISVKGRSNNITNNVEANYIDIGQAATAYNDMRSITKNLKNFAPIHMVQNAGRREAYLKMAARLDDAVKNDHKYTEIIQAPAAWHQNDNGTYNAFQVVYKVVDREIVAQVNKGTMNRDGKTSWEAVSSYNLNTIGNNIPSALVSMDLIYGTGREEDLVEGWDGSMYVPAFDSPGIVKELSQHAGGKF